MRKRWYIALSVLLLAPVYWQPRVQAGDLSSHVYNAWLTHLIETGRTQGLVIVSQTTNILFDLMLGGLFRLFGAELAQRISVSVAVLVFVWGAFRFVSVAGGRPAWHLLPCIAMLAYGWVFHMGFFNFYLSMGLCFWVLAVVWEWRHRRAAPGPGLSGPRAAGGVDRRPAGVPGAGAEDVAALARLRHRGLAAGHGVAPDCGGAYDVFALVATADRDGHRRGPGLGFRRQVLRRPGGTAHRLGNAVSGFAERLRPAVGGVESSLPVLRDQRGGGVRSADYHPSAGLPSQPGLYRGAHVARRRHLRLCATRRRPPARLPALCHGPGGGGVFRILVPGRKDSQCHRGPDGWRDLADPSRSAPRQPRRPSLFTGGAPCGSTSLKPLPGLFPPS